MLFIAIYKQGPTSHCIFRTHTERVHYPEVTVFTTIKHFWGVSATPQTLLCSVLAGKQYEYLTAHTFDCKWWLFCVVAPSPIFTCDSCVYPRHTFLELFDRSTFHFTPLSLSHTHTHIHTYIHTLQLLSATDLIHPPCLEQFNDMYVFHHNNNQYPVYVCERESVFGLIQKISPTNVCCLLDYE